LFSGILGCESWDPKIKIRIEGKVEFLTTCAYYPQTIAVSKKFGFTKFEKDEYKTLKEANRLIPDGSHVKLITNHGTLEEWKRQMEVLARQ
jgi:hypothetical protein